MSQENVEVVLRMLEGFNRGDLDAVLATFGDRCEINEPKEMPDSPAMGFQGHDGVREWMTNLSGVAGVRFEARSLEPIGDVVLSELTCQGLGQASGVPVEWTTFAVVRMRDGRISRVKAFLTKDAAIEAGDLSK
jgi:ketosteroid isomerase-like protein